MKKRFACFAMVAFVFALCGPSLVLGQEGAVVPKVADKFGKMIEIEAEFVEKDNDYFSQNCVDEPFTLRILSVNGNARTPPPEIQYSYSGHSQIAKGVKYQFKAYETIYAFGSASGWKEEGLQQFGYSIRHKLVIKDSAADLPAK